MYLFVVNMNGWVELFGKDACSDLKRKFYCYKEAKTKSSNFVFQNIITKNWKRIETKNIGCYTNV